MPQTLQSLVILSLQVLYMRTRLMLIRMTLRILLPRPAISFIEYLVTVAPKYDSK